MAQYIDKDALIAEIKRRMDENRGKQTLPQYFGMVEEDLNILYYIGTLEVKEVQEDPVSEDLEEAAKRYAKEEYNRKNPSSLPDRCIGCYAPIMYAFRNGAKWQKNHLWKPADGDDLPEYYREVIAILDYDFGHYKVVYAHRPNPNGWNGTNIDTGEKKHFEPEIYDKGGWNQPHILYWLDTRLPYEEK